MSLSHDEREWLRHEVDRRKRERDAHERRLRLPQLGPNVKKCLGCGNEFVTVEKRQVFCSKGCATRARGLGRQLLREEQLDRLTGY